MQNGTATLENTLAVSNKNKVVIIVQPSNFTTGHLFQKR